MTPEEIGKKIGEFGYTCVGLEDPQGKVLIAVNGIRNPINTDKIVKLLKAMGSGSFVLVCKNSNREDGLRYPFTIGNGSADNTESLQNRNLKIAEAGTASMSTDQATELGSLRAKVESLEKQLAEKQELIESLEEEISEADTLAQQALSAPPEDPIVKIIAPSIPGLTDALIDYLKAKSGLSAAPKQEPLQIDYDLLARHIIQEQIKMQQGGGQ